MKEIRWKPKALKQLRKIREENTRITIYDAVDTLRLFPECRNVKKLQSRDEYRLRVGRWRVIFTESLEIIDIQEVKKRDERTY